MKQGLSVYESMNLEEFLKNNIQGLTKEDIKAILTLADGLKGHRFNKPVDISGILSWDTLQEFDGDLIFAEVIGSEALELILGARDSLR